MYGRRLESEYPAIYSFEVVYTYIVHTWIYHISQRKIINTYLCTYLTVGYIYYVNMDLLSYYITLGQQTSHDADECYQIETTETAKSVKKRKKAYKHSTNIDI